MSPNNDVWRLWLPTPVYVAMGALAVYLQSVFAPTWLVSSRAGLQASLQILPAALLALFVLAFTTLFVAAQQVVNVFSSRAPLILAEDKRVRRIVARTALLTVVSLLVSGKIPDRGSPDSWVTATAATVLVASVLLVWSYGRFATLLIMEYTAPRSFVARVVTPVRGYLESRPPQLDAVIFRVFVLRQSMRYALRRDDSEHLEAALEGLLTLQAAYLDVGASDPAVKVREFPTFRIEGWLGRELRTAFISAAETGMRLEAPQTDLDLLTDRFGDALQQSIEAGDITETEPLLLGLAEMATSPLESKDGITTGFSRPATILAAGESAAERKMSRLVRQVVLRRSV